MEMYLSDDEVTHLAREGPNRAFFPVRSDKEQDFWRSLPTRRPACACRHPPCASTRG